MSHAPVFAPLMVIPGARCVNRPPQVSALIGGTLARGALNLLS